MATRRDWDKIKIWGDIFVSNFSSIVCTDSHYVEYAPEQLVEPGQVLADFGQHYHRVIVDHFEGEDAYIRIDGKVYKVEPKLSVKVKLPLSYAWSDTEIYVESPIKDIEDVLEEKDASESQILDAVD